MKTAIRIWPVLALASACASTPAVPPTAAVPKPSHPPSPEAFMWQVRCPRLSGSVTLVGSVHLRGHEDTDLPAAFKKAVDEADVVSFEIDDPSPMRAVSLLYQLGGFAFMKTTHLPEETWVKLMKRLDTLGIDRKTASHFSVWGLIFLVMVADIDPNLTPETGIDKLMRAYAESKEKQLAFLETFESQIRIFSDLPEPEQRKMLDAALTDPAESTDVVDLYAAGDRAGLERLMKQSFSEFPLFAQRILYDRNQNFVEVIQSQLESGATGVVVAGAGHMVGQRSVPFLLESNGCSADPIF